MQFLRLFKVDVIFILFEVGYSLVIFRKFMCACIENLDIVRTVLRTVKK